MCGISVAIHQHDEQSCILIYSANRTRQCCALTFPFLPFKHISSPSGLYCVFFIFPDIIVQLMIMMSLHVFSAPPCRLGLRWCSVFHGLPWDLLHKRSQLRPGGGPAKWERYWNEAERSGKVKRLSEMFRKQASRVTPAVNHHCGWDIAVSVKLSFFGTFLYSSNRKDVGYFPKRLVSESVVHLSHPIIRK